jgi:hypothetical protein
MIKKIFLTNNIMKIFKYVQSSYYFIKFNYLFKYVQIIYRYSKQLNILTYVTINLYFVSINNHWLVIIKKIN